MLVADEASKVARPGSASSQRAKAEAAHRKVIARREAESKVRACYFRFAGNCDVVAFMQMLGFDTTASKDASTPALFNAAVQVSIWPIVSISQPVKLHYRMPKTATRKGLQG